MKAKIIGSALAAAVVAAAIAQAQGPGDGPRRGPGGRPGFGPPHGEFGPRPGIGPSEGPEARHMRPHPPPMFGILDLNGDGVLDEAEIREAPHTLRKLDRDGDGKISPRECFGAPDRPLGGPDVGSRPPRGEGDRAEAGDRPRDPRGEGGGPRPPRPPAE